MVVVSAKGLAEHHDFPGLKAFGRVAATRETAGATTSETRYFALSWMPAPDVLMATVRANWAIENALHWLLDVSFREDEHDALLQSLRGAHGCKHGLWQLAEV